MKKNSDRCECAGHGRAPLTRREMLKQTASGFGMLALSALMADRGYSALPTAPGGVHFPARAKNVIFCFMDGGVSHVDSFDPKPALTKLNGTMGTISKEDNALYNGQRKWLGSPWKFRRYGQCGLPVSQLFPHIATCADNLAVVRSMKGEFPLHSRGSLLLHTGRNLAGHPSLGSWVTYGLGSENQNLPGYVVLHNGLSFPSGLDNFSNGYLPATEQASVIRTEGVAIDNLARADRTAALQRAKLDIVAEQDSEFSTTQGGVDAVESAIKNYELAYRMQSLVPDVLDLGKEASTIQRLYGIDSSNKFKSQYGIQCLRARRMVEAGVRFVEVTCPMVINAQGTWDQHGNLRKGHEANAFVVDQAIAGLIKDLKARGMLEETLVLFSGEFGRTPHSKGQDGRDHHPAGFTLWMAGGGVKGGITYGATDELGMKAVENVATFHDLHATILQLLGLDHEKLVYRHGGRDHSLTDVHGEIMDGVIA